MPRRSPALHLVDLERSEKRRAVDGLDRRQRDGRAHQLSDPLTAHFVERLEHVDAFGEDEVGEQQLISFSERGGGACRELRRVAGDMPKTGVLDRRCCFESKRRCRETAPRRPEGQPDE